MKGYKKKSAVGVSAPATENRKRYTINSILKNGGNVKVLIKRPGEVPEFIRGADIPPEFLSRKLKRVFFNKGFTLIYEPKSKEPMNLSAGFDVFRGTVIGAYSSLYKLYNMSKKDQDNALVWLMNHAV
ncbi:MAG: hypothetical protein IJU51_02045 [Clostridia bacterium]|nr:hypothetical protein [Clostridia bacterium]